MMEEPKWYKYATFDDDGNVNGVKKDAPKEIKDAYKEYLREEKKSSKMKLKI